MKNVRKTFGTPIIGGGTGGTSTTYNIWQLIEGKPILPAGVIGVRKIVIPSIDYDVFELPEVLDLNNPVGLENGVGVALNVQTQEKQLVFTGAGPIIADIWLGQYFYGPSSVLINVTGSNPVKRQRYIVPIATL